MTSAIEVGQPLDAGEAGFADAAGPAAAGAVVGLGGEDLGEVGQVGLPFPDRDLGQPGGLVADGRQFQLAGCGADRGQGGGVGHAGHRVSPVSSGVIAGQVRGGPVVAGQRADRDDRGELPAGEPAGVDQHGLRVQGAGADGLVHRLGQRGGGQGPVAEQHLGQRPGAGGVTMPAPGGVPVPLVRGRERARCAGLRQRGRAG